MAATAVLANGPTAGGSPGTKGGKAAPPPVLAPFTRAAHEHVEPFYDTSLLMDGNSHVAGPVSIPAYGFLRSVLVLVTGTGGVKGGNTVAAAADAPWNVINQIQLTDVNGSPLFGPTGGYNWMLANLFGSYAFNQAPADSSFFSNFDVNGNFAFLLRIPVEITARDALGSLPNQNAASTYKVTYTRAASTDVFTTPPATTLPTVRVRMFLEAWTQPNPVDVRGMPQATVPPAMGTTQFWTETINPYGTGFQTAPFPRVGNLIRQLVLTTRKASDNSRVNEVVAGASMQLQWDGRILINEIPEIRKNYMNERFGFGTGQEPELTGVYVYDFIHDLMGKGGDELRDLYLPTTQATRLELVTTFTEPINLSILTNDVAPTAEIAVM